MGVVLYTDRGGSGASKAAMTKRFHRAVNQRSLCAGRNPSSDGHNQPSLLATIDADCGLRAIMEQWRRRAKKPARVARDARAAMGAKRFG